MADSMVPLKIIKYMKFILFLAIFIYVVPKIMKFSLRWFLSNQMDKVQREFKNAHKSNSRREGDISVDVPNTSKNTGNDKRGGEYIDYEEVK
jgi:hypothetical protein